MLESFKNVEKSIVPVVKYKVYTKCRGNIIKPVRDGYI